MAAYIRRMDEALILARAQFGLNIGFHILFPTITIGLAWILVWFRVRYEMTHGDAWLRAYKLWVKVFALSFAMGVVSGVTMSFQFGTNWPGYMNRVGNIAGPLLAYEVLTAFFLEATFLGVMLFGMERVSGRVHAAARGACAIGRRHRRRELARGDLQSVVPLPPGTHAARLRHHRLVPRR